RVYLITGFLGAGKTTFLKELARCFEGTRVAVIVNDFGRERVDATLLAGRGFALTEVNNGSIFCACREEQFREALRETLQGEPEVVLIEASGLADPSTMAVLMAEPDFAQAYYVGAICLVDGARFHKVLATAAVCRRQLQGAVGVVVNKTDQATALQLADIRTAVAALCPHASVLETTFGRLTDHWLLTLNDPPNAAGPVFRVRDVSLQKLTLVLRGTLREGELAELLGQFIGETYRVKGFAATTEGIVLVDCVGETLHIQRWQGAVTDENRLTVLFDSTHTARKALRRALAGYPQCAVEED
ncbi:MAG: GTP-binding protein, partial [Oscillospiraceae bacterium]